MMTMMMVNIIIQVLFSILRALLAAPTTLSSALSLVFKTIPRSLVVVPVGMVWVLGGLWDGRV